MMGFVTYRAELGQGLGEHATENLGLSARTRADLATALDKSRLVLLEEDLNVNG